MTLEELKSKLIEQAKQTTWYFHMRFFLNSSSFTDILKKLLEEYELGFRITPQFKNLFRAYKETPFDSVRVVIFTDELNPHLYQYTGIAYSQDITGKENNQMKTIFNELQNSDPKYVRNPDLTRWCKQGVLLLTSALTSTTGEYNAHVDLWKPWNNTIFETFKHDLPDAIYVIVGESVWEYEEKLNSGSTVLKIDNTFKNFSKGWGIGIFQRINEELERKGKEKIAW